MSTFVTRRSSHLRSSWTRSCSCLLRPLKMSEGVSTVDGERYLPDNEEDPETRRLKSSPREDMFYEGSENGSVDTLSGAAKVEAAQSVW